MKQFELKKERQNAVIVHHVHKGDTITSGGRKCHFCENISYDDCHYCGKPACKSHGKMFGDNFFCKDHYHMA
jgi:hypothetical protein